MGGLLAGVPSISAVFSLKHGDTTFKAEISNGPDISLIVLGVLFLAIALYLFERKRKHEEKQDAEKDTLEDDIDKKAVRSIMESINTCIIDCAIEKGRLSQFYVPVIKYYDGVAGLAKSSSFMLYNKEIRDLFGCFYRSFESFISHTAHFRPTSNSDLQKFVKPHEISDGKKCEEYEISYLSDVEAFAKAFHSLIDFVKRKHPDIDISA